MFISVYLANLLSVVVCIGMHAWVKCICVFAHRTCTCYFFIFFWIQVSLFRKRLNGEKLLIHFHVLEATTCCENRRLKPTQKSLFPPETLFYKQCRTVQTQGKNWRTAPIRAEVGPGKLPSLVCKCFMVTLGTGEFVTHFVENILV